MTPHAHGLPTRPVITISDEAVSKVGGNAPRKVKEAPLKWLATFKGRKRSFENHVVQRVKVVDVSLVSNPDEPGNVVGKVVSEIDVMEDMLNMDGNLHEGCAALLMDEGSVAALSVLNVAENRDFEIGVSQAINFSFHNPAKLGTKLRIVSSSISAGTGIGSSRSEIWDIEKHRLVASALQLQMVPSRPRKKLDSARKDDNAKL